MGCRSRRFVLTTGQKHAGYSDEIEYLTHNVSLEYDNNIRFKNVLQQVCVKKMLYVFLLKFILLKKLMNNKYEPKNLRVYRIVFSFIFSNVITEIKRFVMIKKL